MRRLAILVAMGFGLALAVPAAASAAPPEYEQAYFNDQTVTINAIEVHQSEGALTHAAADFYQVVYPPDSATPATTRGTGSIPPTTTTTCSTPCPVRATVSSTRCGMCS